MMDAVRGALFLRPTKSEKRILRTRQAAWLLKNIRSAGQSRITIHACYSMATPRASLLQLSKYCARQCPKPGFFTPLNFRQQQIRCAATGTSENAAKYRRKQGEQAGANKKKKKVRNTFIQYNLKDTQQFSLIDAMQ
jgi:hypothetical protein